jgi:cell fate regulator YaaT (PSP1 superfamily)
MDEIQINQPEAAGDTPAVTTQTEIIGVRFKKSGKIYYFNPDKMIFNAGDHAIVETARGLEYGNVVIGNRMVNNTEIISPLRPVIRATTPEDEIHHKENTLKEVEAFNICIEKIGEHKLGMKLIDVEYTFDNNKLLFYFTADGRIDFRELVKDLASVFRTRIELRQIGIRDEAKIMGGLGVCGRPFCCHSFLVDFVQVSIKMAKEQNLSLNSAKISGACGRLMCCLRYEYDVYSEELKLTPRGDSIVDTPDGEGVVVETVPLAGLVKVRLQKPPDQPLKIYHRDNVKIKGYLHKEGDEKSDEELEGLEE